jgi:hypothetical protein
MNNHVSLWVSRMKKRFEDSFSELLGELVAICIEYADDRADEICIYCTCEFQSYSLNEFY